MSLTHSRPGLGLLRLLRWLAIGIACLLVLAVAAVWGVGRALPGMLDSTLASQGRSGLTCEVNDTNLFAGRVDLAGITILNPPEFSEREFLRIRRLVVDVQPMTFLSDGRRVIDELTLDIDRVTLVGKGGDLLSDNNATAIAKAFRRSAKASASSEAAPAAKSGNDFIIRRLKIRVGGVTLLQEEAGRRQVLLSDNEGLAFEASDVTAQNIGDTVIAPLGGLALTRAAATSPESILELGRRQIERNRK